MKVAKQKIHNYNEQLQEVMRDAMNPDIEDIDSETLEKKEAEVHKWLRFICPL